MSAFELVRDVFLLLIETGGDTHEPAQTKLAAYYRAHDALNLTLVTVEGHLVSTSWIHIIDWGDLGREVEAEIDDAPFWQMLHSE
ncbi:MAG TPA: hypothetical protein VGP82_03575 [Ktedonobacterales bacterium]|nr:hypothetical protein [Ktedonobacterales bacterium]